MDLTGTYFVGLLLLTMGLFSVYGPRSAYPVMERMYQLTGRWFLIPHGCVLLLIAVAITVSRL